MTAQLSPDRLFVGVALSVLCLALGGLAGIDPGLAIMASFALAFIFIAFANLTAGVGLFALIIFLEALIRNGGLVSFIKLAGLLLAVSWLVRLATENRSRISFLFASHPQASYLLLALVAWVGLSAIWAEASGDALTEASRYLLNFTLFAIIYTAARRKREFGWLFAAFVVGAATTALYGLLVRPVDDPGYVDRVASTVGNPNELAAVLVAGLALTMGAVFAFRGSALRGPAVLVAAITLLTLVLTGSRGGMIALAVALLAATVFAGRWRVAVIALVTALVVAVAGYVVFFAPAPIQERLLSATPGELQASDEARGTIWQVALRVASDHLVVGVGAGNFNDVSTEYVLDTPGASRSDQIIDGAKNVHNMYLQTLTETGIIGLILFLGIFGFVLRTCWQAIVLFARSGDVRMEILARATLVAMISVMAAGFFSSHQFGKWLWFLFAFGPVLLALARSEEPGTTGPPDASEDPLADARTPVTAPATP